MMLSLKYIWVNKMKIHQKDDESFWDKYYIYEDSFDNIFELKKILLLKIEEYKNYGLSLDKYE